MSVYSDQLLDDGECLGRAALFSCVQLQKKDSAVSSQQAAIPRETKEPCPERDLDGAQ